MRKARRRLRTAALAVLAASLLIAAWQWLTWPDVAALRNGRPESTAFIRAWEASEREAPRAARADQRWVPYAEISDNLKRAVLVAEDIDFFSHQGFAVEEMKSALRAALQEGETLRGASTLSQQLVKNLWLSPSRNPWRKVKEALLTRQLERQLPKRRILEIYLNVVEFGPGTYGAEAAAQRYFGRPASRLSERQAAALAAGLPSRDWHPGSTSQRYRSRVERNCPMGRRFSRAFITREEKLSLRGWPRARAATAKRAARSNSAQTTSAGTFKGDSGAALTGTTCRTRCP